MRMRKLGQTHYPRDAIADADVDADGDVDADVGGDTNRVVDAIWKWRGRRLHV